MNHKQTNWCLAGGAVALFSWHWMSTIEAVAKEYFTEDLGHRNWEEVEPGYFLATELIFQQNHLVVFDIFLDPDLQYERVAGDCNDMLVKRLRLGGISGSEVEFADTSAEAEISPVSAAEPLHRVLMAACEQRERPSPR